MAFVDAQKAFDRVDCKYMLYKLLKIGVTGKLYRIIKSVYKSCDCCLDINGNYTEKFISNVGVRQGDTLSPTMFNTFTNDLPQEINSLGLGVPIGDGEYLSILLYADDIVLIASSENDLQKMLETTYNWGQNWGINFNCDKTKVIHFRKKAVNATVYNFSLGPTILDIVSEYRYLGIFLNEFVDIGKMATVLAESGSRALGSIIHKFRFLNGLGYKSYKTLFDMCVAPVLDYGSGAWGFKDVSKIDTVQNRAMKFYLGVNKFTPSDVIQGDLDWDFSKDRRIIRILNYWNKICQVDDSRLISKVYKWDKNSSKRFTWSWEVKQILLKLKFENEFEHFLPVNLNLVKDEIKTLNQNTWQQNIIKSSKWQHYRKYKILPCVEPYALKIKNRQQRSILAKFRAGVLPLQNEIGRWHNTPLESRLCKLCKQEIENEIHFVLDCPKYKDTRKTFVNKLVEKGVQWEILSIYEKLEFCMNKSNVTIFSNYLRQIFEIRKTCILQ